MSSASGRIEANLGSLLSFAQDLQAHLELMIRDIGDIETLKHQLDDTASLGDFPEAREMTARHQIAVTEVQDLLEHLVAAVDFADQITLFVAAKYAERDQSTATAVGAVASAVQV